jgi:hypothetical protein
MDVYSTKLGIWPSFFKTSEFRGGVLNPLTAPSPGYASAVTYSRYQLDNEIEEWTPHTQCGYVTCVTDCCGSVCCAS